MVFVVCQDLESSLAAPASPTLRQSSEVRTEPDHTPPHTQHIITSVCVCVCVRRQSFLAYKSSYFLAHVHSALSTMLDEYTRFVCMKQNTCKHSRSHTHSLKTAFVWAGFEMMIWCGIICWNCMHTLQIFLQSQWLCRCRQCRSVNDITKRRAELIVVYYRIYIRQERACTRLQNGLDFMRPRCAVNL